ncbi:MAG: acetyltransferase [Pyramidobacter sp.]|nr:acetyltransferase [Pyramidobacter sp.]
MDNQLVIIGASGHGKVIADIAERLGYDRIVFLDDNTALTECGKHRVVGTVRAAALHAKSDFIVAIGSAEIRKKIQNWLCGHKLRVVTLIHPNALVASDVSVGEGTVIMAGAVVNPGTSIGSGCIVNTGATVDHDNVIGDYAHISVGSHLAGTVRVGAQTWIGAGAVVINNISICALCTIGAGAVVVSDIKEPGTYIGVPAKKKTLLRKTSACR